MYRGLVPSVLLNKLYLCLRWKKQQVLRVHRAVVSVRDRLRLAATSQSESTIRVPAGAQETVDHVSLNIHTHVSNCFNWCCSTNDGAVVVRVRCQHLWMCWLHPAVLTCAPRVIYKLGVNDCLCLCVSPVMDGWPVEDIPQISHYDSWERLYPTSGPELNGW